MSSIPEDDYVDVSSVRNTESEPEEPAPLPPSTPQRDDPSVFYDRWIKQASGNCFLPDVTVPHELRKLYPGYSLIMSDDFKLDLLSFPDIHTERIPSSEEVTNVLFASMPRRVAGDVPGKLLDRVVYGSYRMLWKEHEFIVHIMKVPQALSFKVIHFVMHAGGEQPARDLILSAMIFQDRLHDEIWVYNQGFWSRDKGLWSEVQNASWDDIVMKENYKKTLKNDIYGFFEAEEVYKKFAIPWKRGLIMYGPPGNGKTITIKAVIKSCAERGFIPLYVKSFQSPRGKEGAMQDVFTKARQSAPCVLILEDLDSLINDKNRSFFLNQLDGLEGDNGLLVIGSTNHFESLDPGLSKRPSRFDRKYLFDDPDYEERILYAKYWQNKLENNEEISFPDSLVEEVASTTAGFSFAYLKEAIVSALVGLNNASEGGEINFADLLKNQIKTLQKELGKRQGPVKEVITSTKNVETGSKRPVFLQPDVLIPGSLPRSSPEPLSKTAADPLQDIFKTYTSDNIRTDREQSNPWGSWASGSQKTLHDTSNHTTFADAKPSTVLKIKFDSPADSSRGRPSQIPSVFPAPVCAYPQAVKPMPGTLPAQEPALFRRPFDSPAPKRP